MQDRASGVIAAVRDALNRQGSNAFRAARAAGLPDNSIRYLLEGREPKLSRLIEICRAVGLEFYIGPPRGAPYSLNGASDSKIQGVAEDPSPYGVSAFRVWDRLVGDRELAEHLARLTHVWKSLDPKERHRLSAAIVANIELIAPGEFGDGTALVLPFVTAEPPDLPSSRSVPVFGVEIAAGAGVFANAGPEMVEGYLAFDREWLDSRGLNATQCAVVSVRGESMEPTLPAGALILVDRSRRKRREGHVYVVRSDPEDTLVVKRAGREGDAWMLVSDHPEWKPARWPETGAEVIGEVVWTSGVPGAD